MDTNPTIKTLSQQLTLKIKNKEIEVPMLPEVANKVMRLTQDSNTVTTDLSNLIQSDQVLAGHVMRIANSALYSPNIKLVSLQQAISRLGMGIIGEIALAASINAKMFNAPAFNKLIQSQLKYSLYCALWSKEVARFCKRNVEAAFLAGLLQSIGRPVCLQAACELADSFGMALEEPEACHLLGVFARIIGVQVVHRWEMPPTICEVVTWFDQYENAGTAKELTMVCVAANKFAQYGIQISPEYPKLSKKDLNESPVMGDLNLYPEDIDTLIEKQKNIKSTLESMSP